MSVVMNPAPLMTDEGPMTAMKYLAQLSVAYTKYFPVRSLGWLVDLEDRLEAGDKEGVAAFAHELRVCADGLMRTIAKDRLGIPESKPVPATDEAIPLAERPLEALAPGENPGPDRLSTQEIHDRVFDAAIQGTPTLTSQPVPPAPCPEDAPVEGVNVAVSPTGQVVVIQPTGDVPMGEVVEKVVAPLIQAMVGGEPPVIEGDTPIAPMTPVTAQPDKNDTVELKRVEGGDQPAETVTIRPAPIQPAPVLRPSTADFGEPGEPPNKPHEPFSGNPFD